MREIKFLIRDTQEKNFADPTYFLIDMYGEIFAMQMGKFVPTDEGRFVALQYTGLKTEDGKEIYDGDLVNGRGLSGVVCRISRNYTRRDCEILGYDKQSIQDLKTKFPIEKIKEMNEKLKGFHGKIPGSITVIGNIYENSDLITVF